MFLSVLMEKILGVFMDWLFCLFLFLLVFAIMISYSVVRVGSMFDSDFGDGDSGN